MWDLADKTRIHADIESLIKKIDNCKNNPAKTWTTKIGEHIPCGYSISTIWAFGSIENKLSLYFGKNCMKNFSISLRENAANVIDFDKKKMLQLKEGELKLHQDSTVYYIRGKEK